MSIVSADGVVLLLLQGPILVHVFMSLLMLKLVRFLKLLKLMFDVSIMKEKSVT
jgi:hypothetical protein